MISKELLSEVTGMKIGYMRLEDEERTLAYASRFPNAEFWNNKRINIYELAHKCAVYSGIHCSKCSEPEAIFQACQRILENNKGDLEMETKFKLGI
jgi:hypothetical protein